MQTIRLNFLYEFTLSYDIKFLYIPETDFQDLMKDQNGFKISCHTKARTGAYSYGKAL
ncbi:hypothetical protein LEP1GSC055_2444 [Leptospira borgpetersenii str. Brem 307]|uniref:Uncharacterized protein n=1 Tax=Leptospira borgpetersenii str. Brem 328 TaxID=1049780 RepID=A0ABC9SL00_LEPBO|nr:hypothetical protein LEP1GSC055_2444 [Leptospira borgpetersenii str. Brem 307]EMN18500.1 hypothetical protein LEP1GSC056_2227 [Leptospira borgpetersenii str. Brem 328]